MKILMNLLKSIKMSRKMVLALMVLGLVSGVLAVPSLSVEPSQVNRTGNNSLVANQENSVNLTFVNEDSSEDIYGVDPGSSGLETDYISFNQSGFNVPANSSKTIEASIYTEEEISFNDSISVIYQYNTSEGLVTNQSMFPEVGFDVETEYEETNISLNVLNQEFEGGLNETFASTFDIENEGSEKAYNIEVSGGNASFDRSGFEIAESDHQLVDFNVSFPLPEFNRTEATNRTYTTEVNISGDNFESKSFEVEVFVPYKDYLEDETEKQRELIKSIQELKEYCEDEGNKDLPLCGGEIVRTENNTEVVEKQPLYEANLTEDQLNELGNLSGTYSERISTLRERTDILQRNVNELKDSVNGDLSQLNESQRQRLSEIQESLDERNRLLNETKQVRQDKNDRQRTVFYGLFIVFILSLGGFGAVKGYRYVKGDELEEFIA